MFDLDGTLIDSAPGITGHLARAFAAVVPDRALPDLRPFIGPPVATMIPRIAPDLSAQDVKAVLAQFRSSYDADGCVEVTVFPGVESLLRSLNAFGVDVFVATFKPLVPTEKILGALGLRRWIRDLRCVDGPGGPWADKAAMIGDLVAPTAEAVYVGDTLDDERAALAAGVDFIAYISDESRFPAPPAGSAARTMAALGRLLLPLGPPDAS